MKEFYVYIWYYIDTNEVFYVGKGKGKRFKDKWNHRNQYFKNILSKEKDNVAVLKVKEGLSEDESFKLEKELIKEYKLRGEAKANFHEGGLGGNTGNYDNPERSKKLSEFAKSRIGSKNPMYGKKHTEETKRHLREINLGKKLTEEQKEHLRIVNTGRRHSEETKQYLREINLGKKLTDEQYNKMMDKDCPFLYRVVFDGEIVFECLGHTKLWSYCNENYGISRTIIDAVIKGTWKPKFKRHKHLSKLEIIKIDRSVQTNRDECNGVGQK